MVELISAACEHLTTISKDTHSQYSKKGRKRTPKLDMNTSQNTFKPLVFRQLMRWIDPNPPEATPILHTNRRPARTTIEPIESQDSRSGEPTPLTPPGQCLRPQQYACVGSLGIGEAKERNGGRAGVDTGDPCTW